MTATQNEGNISQIEEIQALYTDLALHPEKEFGWAKGKDSARTLGYEERWLDHLPASAWESAAPVGNPFAPGSPAPGEIVVDLGCGAGADLCIASLLVGDHGRVIGIDMTPAMLRKARAVIEALGLTNIELHEADVQALPLADASADLVISNGAINLSPHKPCVFREAFRILKPGGRLQVADMVRACEEASGCSSSWANCVAGTVEPQSYLEMLNAAGFEDATLVGLTDYKTDIATIGATFRARKPS